MENEIHNDSLSIAVDRALLKLSKKHGYSLPEDDPILAQLYLNEEIIKASFDSSVKKLNAENELSKKYFRESLTGLVRAHNEKINSYKKLLYLCAICTGVSTLIAIAGAISLFT